LGEEKKNFLPSTAGKRGAKRKGTFGEKNKKADINASRS